MLDTGESDESGGSLQSRNGRAQSRGHVRHIAYLGWMA